MTKEQIEQVRDRMIAAREKYTKECIRLCGFAKNHPVAESLMRQARKDQEAIERGAWVAIDDLEESEGGNG